MEIGIDSFASVNLSDDPGTTLSSFQAMEQLLSCSIKGCPINLEQPFTMLRINLVPAKA